MQGYRYELYHHGILGQRWGKKNGPPYPLGAGDHSASERKAGWRKSLDKNGVDKKEKKRYNKDNENSGGRRGLTDGQKRAIAIGATVAAGALVTYGAYKLGKSGKLNDLIGSGRDALAGGLGSIAEKPVSDILNEKAKPAAGGLKRLSKPESLQESLKNANPYRGMEDGKNTCTHAAVAGYLRQHGFDVVLEPTGGKMQNQNGVIEQCFKNVKTIDGSAIKFGKSKKDAEEMLIKRFGDNAEGVCGIQWLGGNGGHTFNWKIENGTVTFIDFKEGTIGSQLDVYWKHIDPQGNLQLARLDNAEINFDGLKGIIK